MTTNVLYTTKATATGGRDGAAKTADGTFSVKLSTPKEMGGAGGQGNNPEQLFAAGYAACFLGAIKAAARKEGKTISDQASVTATVGIGPRSDGGGFGLEVTLEATLPGLPLQEAEALVEKAHIICPYSNATRGNIDVKRKVTETRAAA